jgi:hypothetical protein
LEHNGETIRLERGNEAAPMIEELGYATQLRSFCEDLRRGSTPLMDIAFGRLILDIVCAAYRSAGRASREERVPFSGDRTKTPLQLWRDGAAM